MSICTPRQYITVSCCALHRSIRASEQPTYDAKFGAPALVLCEARVSSGSIRREAESRRTLLRNRVGHDQLLQRRLIQHLQRRSTQNAVRNKRDDPLRAIGEKVLGSEREGTARVGHVVDQDRGLVLDVADEDHARDLVGLFALFVEEGKIEVESGRHGRRAATRVASVSSRKDHSMSPRLQAFARDVDRWNETDRLAPPASGETMTEFCTSLPIVSRRYCSIVGSA